MQKNTRIQQGPALQEIHISAGPSKADLIQSVFFGKRVRITLEEALEKHPDNSFDVHIYSVEPSNTSNHFLNYQHTHGDSGDGNKDIPWNVKIAILPNFWMNGKSDHKVHYKGTYDAITRTGVLTLIEEAELVLS